MGDGTDCSTVTCPGLGFPRGACCYGDPPIVNCEVIEPLGCDDTYLGDGTSCEPHLNAYLDDCPPRCGDNLVNQPSEQCDGTDDTACPVQCQGNCTCPTAGCSPDGDGDGIKDSVDELPSTYSNSFVDTSTNPDTRGGYAQRGDQDLCASDAPGSYGVYVESLGTLGGGSATAQVQLTCIDGGWYSKIKSVDAGDCITLTCRSGPTAEIRNSCSTSAASAGAAGTAAQIAAVRDVDVDLLAGGLVVATLVLPEGNSISYNPETLEVTAGTSNNTTLILITAPGEQQPLAPGASTTLPPPAAIPAVSQWGLIALTLVLLVGAKIYFGRRRTIAG